MKEVAGGRLVGREPTGRRPTTVEGRRICEKAGCEVVLSTYNKSNRCWQHRIRPRLR